MADWPRFPVAGRRGPRLAPAGVVRMPKSMEWIVLVAAVVLGRARCRVARAGPAHLLSAAGRLDRRTCRPRRRRSRSSRPTAPGCAGGCAARDAAPAPIVLYFGGNAEEVSWTLADRRWPRDWAIVADQLSRLRHERGIAGRVGAHRRRARHSRRDRRASRRRRRAHRRVRAQPRGRCRGQARRRAAGRRRDPRVAVRQPGRARPHALSAAAGVLAAAAPLRCGRRCRRTCGCRCSASSRTTTRSSRASARERSTTRGRGRSRGWSCPRPITIR